MEPNDIVLSNVNAEVPNLHIISVNGNNINISIELSTVTLIGASIQSVNSEYRIFNCDTQKLNNMLHNNIKECKIFYTAKAILDKAMRNNTLTADRNEVKRITINAMDYSLIYFIMCKYNGYTENDLISLNRFSSIVALFNVIKEYLKMQFSASDMKSFIEYISNFDDSNKQIGSKILTINREEIEHTNCLDYQLWKEIYVYKLIRNIPTAVRANYLSPMLDWGIIKHQTKQLFSNDALISKLNFGSTINYIRMSSIKQNRLAHDISIGALKQYEINDIKSLTNKMVEFTADIDYALDDISLIMFFHNKQRSLFSAINVMMDEIKSKGINKVNSPIKNTLFNFEDFKQFIFQFFFAMLLLARQGVIHNDPHLNNILIESHAPSKLEVGLPNGKIIQFARSEVYLTLIDYDKSILSYHHHNNFEKSLQKINEEVSVVFDEVKDSIVDNYDQVFNCYIMYDIIRFTLTIRKVLTDIIDNIKTDIDVSKHELFVDNILKITSNALSLIYAKDAKLPFDISEPHMSMLWLIETIFKDHIKINKSKSSIDNIVRFVDAKSFVSDDAPEFISSKRRYSDKLKYQYISDYIAKNTKNDYIL